MGLFKNRPLAIICTLSIAVSTLTLIANKFFCDIFIFFLLIGILVSLLATIFSFKNKKIKIRYKIILLCSLTFFIISSILFIRSYSFFSIQMNKSENLNNNYCKVKGYVISKKEKYTFASSYRIKSEEINGEKCNLNLILDCNVSTDLSENDIFEIYGTISDFEDREKYLISDGYNAKIIYDDSKPIMYLGKKEASLINHFQSINDKIQVKLYEFTDKNSGALAGAFLLGNRENIDDCTIRNFRRCGISHLLALSGLHTSILIGFFDLILCKLRINKKIRCFFLIGLSVLYLAITGFSPSATRAVFMIISVYTAYIINLEEESVTSLFLALTIIIAFSPYAIKDIGLWMSFLSTLGIITISNLMSGLKFKLRKRPKYQQVCINILSAISITFAAVIAVSAFSWIFFGEISIISPITNLICSPIMTAILILSFILLILSPMPILASYTGFIISELVSLLQKITEQFSLMRKIVISMNEPYVTYIMIPLIISVLILLLVKLKKKWIIVIPPIVAVIAFSICIPVFNYLENGKTTVSYVKVKNNEMLLIDSQDGATICDISSGGFNIFYDTYKLAFEKGNTEIENLILTHYHMYHANSLKKLCDRYIVRNIFFPEPQTDSDKKYLIQISNVLRCKNINLVIYKRDAAVDKSDNYDIFISDFQYLDRSKHPMFSITVSNGTNMVSYFTQGYFEKEENINSIALNDSDYIIFGCHGATPRPLKSDYILKFNKVPDTLIFSEVKVSLSDKDFMINLNNYFDLGTKVITDNINTYEFDLTRKTVD